MSFYLDNSMTQDKSYDSYCDFLIRLSSMILGIIQIIDLQEM